MTRRHVYGPDNVPQPPHHARPGRALFAWGCLGLIVGLLIVLALWFTSDRADAVDDTPNSVTRREAFQTYDGESRRHLHARIGAGTEELWQGNRIYDYTGHHVRTTLRVRYRDDAWRVRAAWWLVCTIPAECTRTRIT